MILKTENIGLMKTLLDAHTMGVHSAAALLKECGYNVLISPTDIEEALDNIFKIQSQAKIINWIKDNHINYLGISYRLDPETGINITKKVVKLLKKEGLYGKPESLVKSIHFAGLTPTCDEIDKYFDKEVKTFRGGESPEETLLKMGVSKNDIPLQIREGCKYDNELLEFGRKIINEGKYYKAMPLKRKLYPKFGTFEDTLIERLNENFEGGFQPLVRAHSGPFSGKISRKECLVEYNKWCRELASTGYLDILSVGCSQLSQSNFGEDWKNKANGGGVPVNSENEYKEIWMAANPMLVRTYSATKNVMKMAKMYEKTINNAWHALSLWWFNELDGRGPNSLYKSLKEHIETIEYIAKIGKPVETNVPHHFAFRGCDDITYIVSAYLAARTAKEHGVKNFILQNMLNTPRSTWGIQDLVKSRVMLKIVRELEDENFKVILQTRAGLDYFKPDLEEAKIQLAAVTAMMDDIEPENLHSPEIIHVVSYCEALYLATPKIIDESIQITRTALSEYRKLKEQNLTYNVKTEKIDFEVTKLQNLVYEIINAMEENIENLYTAEGLYIAFVAGWLPVPELWSDSTEFQYAKNWSTRLINGGIRLVEENQDISIESRVERCIQNIPYAKQFLKDKYLINK